MNGKEILPPGFEDPYVDYAGWHFSRFGFQPSSEEVQRRQNLLEKQGFDSQKRLQRIMQAKIERTIYLANRSMLGNSDIDPTEDFIPDY